MMDDYELRRSEALALAESAFLDFMISFPFKRIRRISEAVTWSETIDDMACHFDVEVLEITDTKAHIGVGVTLNWRAPDGTHNQVSGEYDDFIESA